MRYRRPTTLLAVVALALAVPAASAQAGWVVDGRGFGHGVGMSQYGAYGYAKHGIGYRRILDHYYAQTSLGQASQAEIRVLLSAGQGSIGFTSASKACGKALHPGRDYVFDRTPSGVVLARPSGDRLKACGASGTASGGAIVTVAGAGDYRGTIEARTWVGTGLEAINHVRLDAYVRGVVPNEMPSSWPPDALRVQAVAARSYALATAGGGDFDVYDDTRSQVYGGAGSETPATDAAVRDTAGQVVEHSGQVATTYFFSSSGGKTENVEYGFPGSSPEPYLKGVRDPYDDVAPDHTWRVTFTQAQMESRLAGLFGGRLQRIRVTQTGVSPRIVTARVVGSQSSSTVGGPTLEARLGLKSTWATFAKR